MTIAALDQTVSRLASTRKIGTHWAYVFCMINEFHQFGKIVKGLNPSFIVLIPKKEEAKYLENFYHISLIGSAYGIIYKVVSKILSKVFDPLFLEQQSAFIGGR